LPKGKLFESIIEKATELGVHRIVPLLSERVVPQVNSKEAAVKAAKWKNVAVEAIKQCGCPWLPQVEVPLTPTRFLQRNEQFDLALVGSLEPGSEHPRDQFRRFEQEHQYRPRSLAVWIGPEGDFTSAELKAIQVAGAEPITLGPRVLRTETAAIYCLSIINYEQQAPVS
jgi:16S rRNA (uracil1498-N3)-methyltransferase